MARRLSAHAGAGLAALTLGVLAVHGCVGSHIADRLADAGAAAAMPARLQVSFVREMETAAPRVAAAARAVTAAPVPPPPPARRATARRVAEAASDPASAPEVAVAEPTSVADPAPAAPATAAPVTSAPQAVADAASAAASAAVAEAPGASTPAMPATGADVATGAPAFEWPVSTRLSYLLSGNYRGEIHGRAQVEWLRDGDVYQVHLDITVGLPFAPLLSRRMSSQGRLGPEGLLPQRYDEDSKVAFRERRRLTMGFEPDAIVMANGERRPRTAGVQDTASQFVQLAYLFGTQPGLATPGGTVEMPLALPRRVNRWTYDVLDTDVLHTPFGPIAAVHLQPRLGSAANGELTAEIWFAPELRYLPVRIRIRQDAETFIDLMIERKPELAAG